MGPVDELVRQLEASKGDIQAQAAAAAAFFISAEPEASREAVKAALDAAATLRWFDARLLAEVLEISEEEAKARFATLNEMPFIETFRTISLEHRNIHEATRLGWRKHLAHESPAYFQSLSARAAQCFAGDAAPKSRIERVYHLLCGDPDRGAEELDALDREWSNRAHPEDRYALAAALQELQNSKLLQGRARVRMLLSIADARSSRGEIAQLESIAREALEDARRLHDERAEGDALSLVGDVFKEQGKLIEAQKMYEDCLAISQRLAEREPDNANGQHDLAAAYVRMGDVFRARGKLDEAETEFDKFLKIIERLAQSDRGNTGWQCEVSMAHGRMGVLYMAQSKLAKDQLKPPEEQAKLADAQAAFARSLAIIQQLANEDPNNADWQREVAVTYSWVGAAFEAQDGLALEPTASPEGKAGVAGAQEAFKESLTINRRLAEKDPANAGWQRELAVSMGQMGRIAEADGNLVEAQAVFGDSLTISRRLAEQDPANAGWQRDLAIAYARLGVVFDTQGELAKALSAFEQYVSISRRLAEQDPSNAEWQSDLTIANGWMEAVQAKLKEQEESKSGAPPAADSDRPGPAKS